MKNRVWLLIGLVGGGIIAGLIVVFVAMPFALGHRNDLPLERLYADAVVSFVSRTQAGSVSNATAQNPRSIEAGRMAYTGSCAVCHGANGDGKGAFGTGLYPPASDLTAHDTQEKSDAQLFWIIKNGLSFAGMPAFGDQYSDQDIWNLVNYTRSLGQSGMAQPIDVPATTAEQLAMADPHGTPEQRGAAVYFSLGCNLCHGATGNAPGELRLRGAREAEEAVREGRRGMPAFSTDVVSDAQLTDLLAYMNSWNAVR